MRVLITAMKALARISLQVAVLSLLLDQLPELTSSFETKRLQCELLTRLSVLSLQEKEKRQTISAIQLNTRTNTSKTFLVSLPGIILQVTDLQLLRTH